MACFTAPLAESLIVKAVERHVEQKEKEETNQNHSTTGDIVIPWSRKVRWLTWLLWGGSVLLAFEHVWHGEIVPWFPFLTAMYDPADTAAMLSEIATTGVTMAALITAVWFVMCKAADAIVKRGLMGAQRSAA